MRVVTGARSGRCGHPLSRPLVASRGALLPPSLLALMGRPPPLPTGEAVIMMDALRAIPLSGACCGLSQYLMQQRRAVRATVREEWDGAAGDEEPATKSRASSLPTV